MSRFDPTPYITQDEGQHYDRKSLFHGAPGKKTARPRRKVRDQVAEYVAAFANAEGGVLILGIEDDGTLTGHGYSRKPLETLLATPRARCEPPQPAGFTVAYQGVELIVFDVPASDVPVKVTGDGFPLRMGDRTVETSESKIRALKFQGMAQSWESRPSTLSLGDLSIELLDTAKRGSGLQTLTHEEYLLKRKLADRRGQAIVLRNATELLFAEHGPDHPNAGVRLFRVVGTERKLGAEHNVEERPRIEGNLPEVLDEAMETISGLLRRPSRLVGTKFQQAPEYPDFAWREALLNAVAHRDYSTQGRCVEVWLYDDRMEIVNPGALMPEVSIQSLRNLERLHASRNPRLVRALVDLGFMRDQGEGIPRMFHEMADAFLPTPELEERDHSFSVTLRNTLVLEEDDKDFVQRLNGNELSREEFRALLEAHRHSQVDNARLRRLTGLDTLQASQLLRRLRDKGYLDLHAAGANSYYTLDADFVEPETLLSGGSDDKSGGSDDKSGGSDDKSGGSDDKSGGSDDKSGGSEATGQNIPPNLLERIRTLGSRARKQTVQALIADLCSLKPFPPGELAALLGRKRDHLTQHYLSPMVEEGVLERLHPVGHPRQAYRRKSR